MPFIYIKSRQKNLKQDREAMQRAEVPSTASEMSVKGTNSDGKLVCVWSASGPGKVEVEVTLRSKRDNISNYSYGLFWWIDIGISDQRLRSLRYNRNENEFELAHVFTVQYLVHSILC